MGLSLVVNSETRTLVKPWRTEDERCPLMCAAQSKEGITYPFSKHTHFRAGSLVLLRNLNPVVFLPET